MQLIIVLQVPTFLFTQNRFSFFVRWNLLKNEDCQHSNLVLQPNDPKSINTQRVRKCSAREPKIDGCSFNLKILTS